MILTHCPFPLSLFRRYFQFHCTSSGRRLGGYLCTSWCTCLDYDSGARYVFIGDYSGNITVCKLDDGGPAGGAGQANLQKIKSRKNAANPFYYSANK